MKFRTSIFLQLLPHPCESTYIVLSFCTEFLAPFTFSMVNSYLLQYFLQVFFTFLPPSHLRRMTEESRINVP